VLSGLFGLRRFGLSFGGWLVDPRRVGDGQDFGIPGAAEPFGVPAPGGGQDGPPLGGFAGREAVVDVCGSV